MPFKSKARLRRVRNLGKWAKPLHLRGESAENPRRSVAGARNGAKGRARRLELKFAEVPPHSHQVNGGGPSSDGLQSEQQEGGSDEASVKMEDEIKLEFKEEEEDGAEEVNNKLHESDDEEEIPLPPAPPSSGDRSDPLDCDEDHYLEEKQQVLEGGGGEASDAGAANRCLLCYRSCCRRKVQKSSKRSGGGNGGAARRRQRQPPSYVMFILKRLLGVPEGLLEECHLHSKNFNNWMTLCEGCSQLVQYCVGVNDQIARLLEELQTHRHRIIERVKKNGTSSSTTGRNTDGGGGGGLLDQRDSEANFVTNAVRDCVAKKEYSKSEEICCCFPAGDNGTAARVETKLRIALHFTKGGGGGGEASRSRDKKRVAPKRGQGHGHDDDDDIPTGAQSVPAASGRPTKKRSLTSKPNLKKASKKSKNVRKLANTSSSSPHPSPPDPLDNDNDDGGEPLTPSPSPSPAQSTCASAILFSSSTTSKGLLAPPKRKKVPSLLRRRPVVKGLAKSQRKSPIVTTDTTFTTNSKSPIQGSRSSNEAKTNNKTDDGNPPFGINPPAPPNPKFPEVYTCNLCVGGGGGKMDVHNFLSHILFHQERPYRCSDCDTYLPRDEFQREAHWEAFHAGVQAEFRFLEVGSSSSGGGGLKAFHCVVCPKTFQTDGERDKHLQDVHHLTPVEKTLPCKSCHLKFAANDELLIHRALVHPEVARFSCPVCDDVFKKCDNSRAEVLDQRALQAHLDAEHAALSIPMVKSCPYCGSRWSSSNPEYAMDMQVHLKLLHGKSVEIVYGCKYCDDDDDDTLPFFDTATNLKGHMHQHKKQVGAYARPPLQKWQRIEPLSPDKFRVVKELLQCPSCVQVSTTEDILKRHMDTMHQPRVCHICGWKGKLACEMRRHQFVAHGVVEEGAKMLVCPQEGCAFQTVSVPHLTKHSEIHMTVVRKHVCRHCGKAFKCSSHRREHELIHVNAKSKPYQCEICGNSFALRNYLYIHKRLSHEGRTFPSTNKKKKPYRSKKRKMNNASGQSSRENAVGEGGSSSSSMDLVCHETLAEEN